MLPPGTTEKGGTGLIDYKRIEEHFRQLLVNESSLKCLKADRATPGMIDILKRGGCRSVQWDTVYITPETDLNLVSNCIFQGEVHIHLPAGILSSTTLDNCRLEGPLSVTANGVISGMTLMPGSTVEYCGSIIWNDTPGVMNAFIDAGVETGERSVPVIPVLDHNDAAFLGSSKGRSALADCILIRTGAGADLRGIIGCGATVRHCPCMENSIVLGKVRVDNPAAVRGSILLEGASVTDGALVRNSVLQWNSTADSFAVVENSIVGEYASVERHGKLTASFLGADSVLGEGEVTASVVGPLTGIHHQSLLIAAMWPGGMGNIGYGANIGSNHTSRLPDQEIRPGTGQFFGLGTSVKFPSDFSRSPFTIIATGLITLPQRVCFPFSLITLPSSRPPGVPDGWCQLVPGWMLYENLYSVLRNAWKYAKRLRAVHTIVNTSVFTDELLEIVRDAKNALETHPDSDVPGAGKNYITFDDRLKGIEAYRKCLRAGELWKIYIAGTLTPGEALEMLNLLDYLSESVTNSRLKDYARGEKIIDDYSAVRLPSEKDAFLVYLAESLKPIREALLMYGGNAQ
jgi:hypothetical protein